VPEISHEELNKLVERLHVERGLDFRGYKPSSLGRRVQRRLDATKSPDIESYLNELARRPDEYSKLVDSILINVTQFFREPEAWEFIKSEIIPQIMEGKHPGDQIRMWSAGCATGEEAYSLAIALSEVVGPAISGYDVRLYATDIDESALNVVRRAEYTEDQLQSVSPELLERYFTKNGRWTLNRDIRKMVIFGQHNLVSDAPISHADLIACRNVLIYMSTDLQSKVLSKLYYGLEPKGFLFLGKAESLLAASRLFSPVNEKWRIFRKESAIGYAGRVALEQREVGRAADTSSAEQQLISTFNESVLRHTPSGVVAVDDKNVVRVLNSAAGNIWGIRGTDLLGKSVFEINISASFQDILPKIAQARSQRSEVRVEELNLSAERGRPLYVSVALNPMYDVKGNNLGVIIVAENITNQVQLRAEVEAANEQMQATNEELETTNEELQSTNEELETTNEELQSTNEELETTNEELQSTNEELSTTNDELAVRTDELDSLSLYYGSVLNSLDVPIVVLNEENVVTTWNPAAEQFYGVRISEALYRNFFDFKLPVRVARTRERLRRLRDSRKPYRSGPIPYKTLTGDVREVVIEYQPLIDSMGSYRGAISIVRDAKPEALESAVSGK
jgi:two-component system CheB/CheR fusion protein